MLLCFLHTRFRPDGASKTTQLLVTYNLLSKKDVPSFEVRISNPIFIEIIIILILDVNLATTGYSGYSQFS